MGIGGTFYYYYYCNLWFNDLYCIPNVNIMFAHRRKRRSNRSVVLLLSERVKVGLVVGCCFPAEKPARAACFTLDFTCFTFLFLGRCLLFCIVVFLSFFFCRPAIISFSPDDREPAPEKIINQQNAHRLEMGSAHFTPPAAF